jgi:Lhr-like helicase
LCAVVCTSSLDLGVDWGDVDLVINVGAPKGASRLLQRIGRSNHRLDKPSQAVLVPANRFEVLECRAAIDAVAEDAQDTPPLRTGALDVLAQHVLGRAVGALISTPRSISLPPAATRSKPMSASLRSGRARTGAGASPIRGLRSATA